MKLVVFDIDGTLVSLSTHIIENQTLEVIHQLKKNEIKVAIATGRQYFAIAEELRNLEFDYYLCGNGSCVCDSKGVPLLVHAIDDEIIESLKEDFIKYNYPLALRYSSGTLNINPNIPIQTYSRAFFTKEQFNKMKKYNLTESPKDEKAFAFLAHIERESLEELSLKYPGLLFTITGGGKLCDITLKEVHKGNGLIDLCELLRIDIADCMAFGDDANDIEMIDYAGVGIAMGNAIDQLKAKADYITSTCEDQGIVKALKHYKLI